MGYSTGMLDKRVKIMKKKAARDSDWGREEGGYELLAEVWASVDWTRGVRAMREGAMEAYDTVMVRMRWREGVDRDCRIVADGKTYQIETLHGDRREGTLQMTASEMG